MYRRAIITLMAMLMLLSPVVSAEAPATGVHGQDSMDYEYGQTADWTVTNDGEDDVTVYTMTASQYDDWMSGGALEYRAMKHVPHGTSVSGIIDIPDYDGRVHIVAVPDDGGVFDVTIDLSGSKTSNLIEPSLLMVIGATAVLAFIAYTAWSMIKE